MITAQAKRQITHAYVGFHPDGSAYFIFVDDASKDCAREVAKVIRGGGRIERMTIEEAREVRLSNRTHGSISAGGKVAKVRSKKP
jgi:hypothetical protein